VIDTLCVACKAGFCWCFVSLLQTVQKKCQLQIMQLLYKIMWRTTKEMIMQLQVL